MSRDASESLATAAQIADRLQVQKSTVLEWGRTGRIPAIKLSPRLVRFDMKSVLASLGIHVSA